MNQYTPKEVRFDASYSPEPITGCWLWAASVSTSRAGDMRPMISINGKPTLAYRYSYQRFVGEIPQGKMICHACNVSICVRPDHLYAGTALDNARDCVRAGRHGAQVHKELFRALAVRIGKRPKPSKGLPGRSIIPHADLPSIRSRLHAGETMVSIAKTYGVSHQAVRRMLQRDAARAALALARGEA